MTNKRNGFPIHALGNDRNVMIPRSLEIVGNDKDEIPNQVQNDYKY